MTYTQLFFVFLKFGSFTFGGGYAMIGFIERYFVSEKKLVSASVMSDFIATAQVVPGMIALNLAHLVGRYLKKYTGGLIAVVAVSIPSILIISIIAYGFQYVYDMPLVVSALKGILMGVIIVLIQAMISVSKALKDHHYMFIYSALVCVSVLVFNISVLIVMTFSVFMSILYHVYILRKKIR